MPDHISTHAVFLRDVGVCVIASAVLAVIGSLFSQPVILAYLAAGVLLGPSLGFNLVGNQHSIELISEIGLILLMFILGQEIQLKALLRSTRLILVASVFQFVGCFLMGWLLFDLLGPRAGTGPFNRLYLAFLFSMSSTMVVIKVLSERFDLNTLVSRITVGVLIVQDLAAIAFLSFQPNLRDPVLSEVVWSVTKGTLLVAFSFGAAKFVLPGIFRRILHFPDLVLITSLAWCFAVTGLSDYMGLSKEIGSLLAGVSIASFPFHMDVAMKVSNLRDFFVTLFFVGLGLRAPRPDIATVKAAAIISAVLVVSRIVTVFPALYSMGLGIRSSILPAINLAQLSEFAPIVLAIGASLGHVDESALSLMLMVLVFTILTSSYFIPFGHDIAQLLSVPLRAIGFKDEPKPRHSLSRATAEQDPQKPSPKVILYGFFRNASSLLYEWFEIEEPEFRKSVVVVDYNPISHNRLQRLGVHSIFGDVAHTDILNQIDLSRVELILCTMPDNTLKGTSNSKLLNALRRKIPNAKIVVTTEVLPEALELYRQGADYVYIPRLFSARGLLEVLQKIRGGDSDALKRTQIDHLTSRDEVLP